MTQFLLLLYGDPTRWQTMPKDQLEAAHGQYMAWGREKRESGLVLSANKLFDEPGKLMRGPKVTDGPYGETKEWLGGYYLIEAADYDDAVKRVADHPHLKYDGTMVLRQVQAMPKR